MSTAPYGLWQSPISAAAITQDSIQIDSVLVDAVRGTVYHIELRPSDGGRNVVVNTRNRRDVFGAGWNARTGVHEYGGAPAIVHDGVLYFSNIADSRIYRIVDGTDDAPTPVTPADSPYRYANFAVHPAHPHLLVAILEDHADDTPQTVKNSLCVIDASTTTVTLLPASDDDPRIAFFAGPVFSPSGRNLAYQRWRLPDMPWEGADVCVADVHVEAHATGKPVTLTLANITHIAGAPLTESACYPAWADDNTLVFTCDALVGFQNPWVYKLGVDGTGTARPALDPPLHLDFAEPAWTFGLNPYVVLDEGNGQASNAFCVALRDGRAAPFLVDLRVPGVPVELSSGPYTTMRGLRPVPRVPGSTDSSGSPSVVFLAQQGAAADSVVLARVSPTGLSFETLMAVGAGEDSAIARFPPGIVSVPRSLTLQRDAASVSGLEGDLRPTGKGALHVVFYAPTNPTYAGTSIPGECPPVIVHVHGGPTSMERQSLNWSKQYFTSRGYAWLDVNYGGSSGYGREYVSRLSGNWGVVDIEDCIDAVKILASPAYGLVDRTRAAIRGPSAGGYTALATLATASLPARTFFRTATSLFGVADLVLLARDTHKFELKFMDNLLGGTVEEKREVYEARSAYYHAEKIVRPLLLLQGADDRVVPPDQAKEIVAKILAQPGGSQRVEFHLYPGEGHGWRKAETMVKALEAELAWYEKTLL